jgi:hypothetical protein
MSQVNKWSWMIILAGLVALVAGCGSTSDAEPVGPSATPVVVLTADDVQRITVAEAKAFLDDGVAALYDTRPVEEYRAQHAAGAISFPEADVVARYGELPADKALIFY